MVNLALRNIRNADGRLVAQINEASGEVIIAQRGCVTKIRLNKDGTVSIVNTKAAAA